MRREASPHHVIKKPAFTEPSIRDCELLGRAQGQGFWSPAGLMLLMHRSHTVVRPGLGGLSFLTPTAQDVAQIVDAGPDACSCILPLPVTMWENLSKSLNLSASVSSYEPG